MRAMLETASRPRRPVLPSAGDRTLTARPFTSVDLVHWREASSPCNTRCVVCCLASLYPLLKCSGPATAARLRVCRVTTRSAYAYVRVHS